jgi:hypothetical protein
LATESPPPRSLRAPRALARAAGQSLDWFWKPWFFEWGYPDLGIQGVVKNEAANCFVITIERKGTLPIPVWLTIVYTDGTKETVHKTAEIWKDGKANIKINAATGKTISEIKLGNRNVPDSNSKDNSWQP